MTPARLHTVSHVVVREGGSDRADWRKRAKCLDEDPELFYPIGAGEAYQPQIAAAKAVCAGCPVRVTCREDALDHESGGAELRFGIRGGLDGNERANVHRTRQRKAKREAIAVEPNRRRTVRHGTDAGYDAHLLNGEVACDLCKAAHAARARAERRRRQAMA